MSFEGRKNTGQTLQTKKNKYTNTNKRLNEANTNELKVLIVNGGIVNTNELTKSIKNAWVKEYNDCNWIQGSEKMSKFNKLVIRIRKESVTDVDNFSSLNERVYDDVVKLGREMLHFARESVFKKITTDKDVEWLRGMAFDNKCTLKDRVESCSILIQNNPTLYYKELDMLLNMVLNVNNKTGYIKMIDTILTTLLNDKVFPKNRELHTIYGNKKLEPLFKGTVSENSDFVVTVSMFDLIQIYFENYLKEWYIVFTNTLIKMLNDTLWTIRKKIITVIFHLCLNIAEQRYSMINALVHKFGDREDKVASHSTYLLGEILRKNENGDILYTTIDIISDHISKNLESFYSIVVSNYKGRKRGRKGNKDNKGQSSENSSSVVYRQVYRLMLFISEIKLSKNYNFYSLPFAASRLPPPIRILSLCLSSLRVIVDSETSHGGRMTTIEEPLYRLLRVTLNCINRSLPYAEIQIRLANNKASNKLLEDFETQYIPKLYFLCHNIECGSIRIVILNVLYRISKILNILSDRYYRLFYSQLLYRPIYNSKNKKLLVYLTWRIINDGVSYKIVISLLKRAIQISIHNYDVSMLLSFLIILVNVIMNFDEKNKGKKKTVRETNAGGKRKLSNRKRLLDGTNGESSSFSVDIKEGAEGGCDESPKNNVIIASNVLKELIIKSDSGIASEFEEEHFVDFSEEEDGIKSIIHVGNNTKSECNNKGTTGSYDPLKRDPNYSNSESVHFWEIDMLKSFYHPLLVEIVRKCLLLCFGETSMNFEGKEEARNELLNSLRSFIRKFKFNCEVSMGSNKSNSIDNLFEISSTPLFLQILSYNEVDLNLILLRCFDHAESKEKSTVPLKERNMRINSFTKWKSSYIPEYLHFYKYYFDDEFVQSVNKYNKLNSELSTGNDYNEDDFEVDYDETTGKIIKQGRYTEYRNDDDVMIDSLFQDLSDIKEDHMDLDDEYSENHTDFDLSDQEDFMEDDADYDFMDDEGDFENNSEISTFDEASMDDILEEKDIETDQENDGCHMGSLKSRSKKHKTGNRKKDSFLNSVTFVDADEMEEYLS